MGIAEIPSNIIEIDPADLNRLARNLAGKVILPDNRRYDAARKIFNARIDRHPAVIVRCAEVSDVITAVEFAREAGLETAVKSGGHSVAGYSVCQGGLVIDLSHLKALHLNPEIRVAAAQPGLTWGEFDRAAAPYELAVTGGPITTTGVAGFTLGGGLGWLMRQFGLACDNLVGADVVTAEGKLLIADAEHNDDLFWGLKGGGGNFGIVTELRFRLHALVKVTAGATIYPVSQAYEALSFFLEYLDRAPDELTAIASFGTVPPMPLLPGGLKGRPVLAVVFCWCGDPDEGRRVIKPMTSHGKPLLNLVTDMPYADFQSLLDIVAKPHLYNYWATGFLSKVSAEAIRTAADFGSQLISPYTHVDFHHMGGAVARVPEEATAFTHRDAHYCLNIVSIWDDPDDSEEQIRWTQEFDAAMQPHFTGGKYVNFMPEADPHQVREAYGPVTYTRLARLKAKYDPDNFFHLNPNVRPKADFR